MLKRIRERMNESEGFTLIELMVVVLIIAILIAIAIPTFLGARERAQDRAAQSSLRNALTAAKTIFTDNEDYTEADETALQESEPSLTFVSESTDSTDPKEVSVGESIDWDGDGSTTAEWMSVGLSNSGKCFGIRDDAQGPGTEFAVDSDNSTTCDATSFNGGALETDWNGDGW